MLKTVVFPAPLGPMMLTISPRSTWKSTPSTARSPPNSIVRFSTSRSVTLATSDPHAAPPLIGAGSEARQPHFQPSGLGTTAQEPIRSENHDDDEKRAVEDHPVLGDRGSGRAEELGQERHQPGAEHGTEQIPQPAQDDHREKLHRNHKTKGGRIEVAEPIREQRDRKSTRLNSSHVAISYAVIC